MNKTQIAIVAGALILVVLLYIAPRTSNSKGEKKNPAVENTAGHSFDKHLQEAKKGIDSIGLARFDVLESQLKIASGEQKIVLLDSLINFWDGYRNYLAAAYYAKEVAALKQTGEAWKDAGDRSFFASRTDDEHTKAHAFEDAIACYVKLLAIDPANTDAKINLGVCYVESSTEAMKGIGLLKEVLQADSNNVKAHLNLGYFSIKSGQYDKAIERFEKILKIDPSYIDAYLYLGDVYESKGEKDKAIESYQKYKASVKDPRIVADIDKYIEKLKNKNNT